MPSQYPYCVKIAEDWGRSSLLVIAQCCGTAIFRPVSSVLMGAITEEGADAFAVADTGPAMARRRRSEALTEDSAILEGLPYGGNSRMSG